MSLSPFHNIYNFQKRKSTDEKNCQKSKSTNENNSLNIINKLIIKSKSTDENIFHKFQKSKSTNFPKVS